MGAGKVPISGARGLGSNRSVREVALRAVTESLSLILNERDDDPSPEPIDALTQLYSNEAANGWGLDLDSLEALDLITMLEESYGVTLTTEVNLDELRTVGDIADAIATYIGQTSRVVDDNA